MIYDGVRQVTNITRRGFMGFAAMGAVALTTKAGTAGPKPELWDRWTRNDAASVSQVNNASWQGFLDACLKNNPTGLNKVNYAGAKPEEQKFVDDYVALLSSTEVSKLNPAEQKAYWINFYNALTIQVVLDHMPVKSILDIDISPGLFSQGPWGKKLVTVEGEALSLDDMEHRILRPIWKDPRIHYGVNCASVGCPDLVMNPYDPATLDATLTANAIAYVNSPRGVRIENGKVIASKIYDWFIEDFGDSEAGILAHLRQYAQGDLKVALESATKISDYEYDWSLNAA